MIHSITSNWENATDKVWAMWYWNHIARRQTTPMELHGMALTDPIRQFNDYGYTMCSTIAGQQLRDLRRHGAATSGTGTSACTPSWRSSTTAAITCTTTRCRPSTRSCDGKTLAGVEEIGREGACEASGGKGEPGHIAKYHCLTATSPNGFLTGCDTIRAASAEEYSCFNPGGLKYRYYFNDWDLGHRYILNLRDGEVYTRYYRRLDADSPNAVAQTDKTATTRPTRPTSRPIPGRPDGRTPRRPTRATASAATACDATRRR